MISREGLQSIPELKLLGKLNKMSDSQFNSYVQDLDAFIDNFPVQADRLRSELRMNSYDKLSSSLASVCETLKRIHADGLAAEGQKQVASLRNASSGNIDYDTVETNLEHFIGDISTLSIDIQMSDRKAGTVPPPRAQQSAWSGSHLPTILAVDNAIMFLNILKKLLKDAPYELHGVYTCDDALEYLRDNRPNVILMDIEMPDMDGFELTRRIKASGQRAPIIFVTANSGREYVDKALAVGAVGLLVKPIRIKQLLDKLKEYA